MTNHKMAEKDANNSFNSIKNSVFKDFRNETDLETDELGAGSSSQSKTVENESFDVDPCASSHESSVKKEENPFSFKKFLNQDSSAEKNKGARKKVFPASSVSVCNSNGSNGNLERNHSDINPRLINNGASVSSVLPDFVQDHLVIEQCYLSGSSKINIDSLNFKNLPDLNLEHQNAHFTSDSSRDRNHSSNKFTNLPDFTLGARNNFLGVHKSCKNEMLPDFALNVGTNSISNEKWANSPNGGFIGNSMRSRCNESETNESNHQNRPGAPLPSSPSVPLDLPSYENSNESNSNMQLSFDLTRPIKDKGSSSRGANASDPVSISLPDFLSDGPIKKELDENYKSSRGDSSISNGFVFAETSSIRVEHERLIREIDSLRGQLSEKNMRIKVLESELQHLQSSDQKETASLEHAFKEVESNLKHTTKRALLAEEMLVKLKQQNKLLKSEICSLKSENMELKLGLGTSSQILNPQNNKNQKIAKELRAAANMAETSLKSLLNGIENLRIIASTMENVPKFQDNCEDYDSFLKEDSASGPAL